ncbi:hypothetical protein [Thermovenabulum gondwanense]|uniref:Uncharacterized protein n=1 Tax=Thermovenabulum gondwanense TaxID=520767 RepID=A0A162MUX1_9FIRM|nr:hypothetical protein [Thermovenabulum gondwanense]KYO67774.1 hypothetical protein ATZ99_04140 [Thermovenabulum gondwanense]
MGSKLQKAGKILQLQTNIQNLEEEIKYIDADISSRLHDSLVQSSSYIKLQKLLDEVCFLLSYLREGNNTERETKDLLKTIRKRLILISISLLKDIQKNLLKSAESLNTAQEEFIMLSNIQKLYKTVEENEKNFMEG